MSMWKHHRASGEYMEISDFETMAQARQKGPTVVKQAPSPPARFPKLVCFEVDHTVWQGFLDEKKIGLKGLKTPMKLEDNLKISLGQIQKILDLKNPSADEATVTMSSDFPSIVSDLVRKNKVPIAIVSANPNTALVKRALELIVVGTLNKPEPGASPNISAYSQISQLQVMSRPKNFHFENLKTRTGIDFHDMLLFDCNLENTGVELWQGVTIHIVQRSGLTMADYQQGLEAWRRNAAIRIPFPQSITELPKRRAIGYVGTDDYTYMLYLNGKRREKSDRPSRWGFGMYITDNPDIACFYSYLGRETKETRDHRISLVYVRDYDVWKALNKVWIAEQGSIAPVPDSTSMTDLELAQSQANRDAKIKELYGVDKPYVLISRHVSRRQFKEDKYKGTRLGALKGKRFNEMVIFPQVQDALFFVAPLSDNAHAKIFDSNLPTGWDNYKWETTKFREWNIQFNDETKADFARNKEDWELKDK
ncbi:acid phosphatase-domain-containing protein [Lasiosphaeria ovina]|uniref:Acid phosphatase-domain-containing protein n=1 Tax=Lasiosphaeria ovina TaxID=92902 RepID=A0AAE0KI93_9PEZI|nr:acid phosphatase-domain-containing protein [Lasiosphaeria ovina]